MSFEALAVVSSDSERSSKWKFADWEDQIPIFGYWAGEQSQDPAWEINPEKKLCFAVLLSAFTDLQTEGERRDLAIQWMEDRDYYPFGFDWVCDAIDIDPLTLLRLMGRLRILR